MWRNITITFTIIFMVFLSGNSAYAEAKLKGTHSEMRALTLGVFPYLSAVKLLNLHHPLVQYLNQRLPIKVQIVSAPNFAQFIQRTQDGDYDFVITAPHMGRLAEMQSHYQRVAMSANQSHAVFVVKQHSPIRTLVDLVDSTNMTTIGLPPEKAIISQLALNKMRSHGIDLHRINLHFSQSHNNALLSLLRDEVEVAVIGYPTWKRYPMEQKRKLQVITQSESIPGFLVMAHPRIDQHLLTMIQEQLYLFHQTENGQAYFSSTALNKFVPIEHNKMQDLTEYVETIFRFKPRAD